MSAAVRAEAAMCECDIGRDRLNGAAVGAALRPGAV